MPYDHYEWLEEEAAQRHVAEKWDAERRAAKARQAKLAETWDPRRDGWDAAPSVEWRDTWIAELRQYRDFMVLGGGNRVQVKARRPVVGHRRRMPVDAWYGSLAEAVAAIDSGRVEADFELDKSEYDPNEDLADRAWQGGAPGLGKRR